MGDDPAAGGARRVGIAFLVALVATAAFAGVLELTSSDDGGEFTQQEGEVFLEPIASVGPDPFTTDVDTEDVEGIDPSSAPAGTAAPSTTAPPGGAAAVASVSGGAPGLYGGTQNVASCDPAQLVAFLEANPDKAAAWVAGINADPSFRWSGGDVLTVADIADFVAELTPIVLTVDTRVTNNGFRNGRPTPRQAVLAAGTAVLVDSFGVPRAKCSCGNPLAPPRAVQGKVTYTGPRWPTFQPTQVIVVAPAPQPQVVIVIVAVDTGELIERPVGTTGDADDPTGQIVSGPLVTEGPPPDDGGGEDGAAGGVLTSRDFCTALREYVQIADEQFSDTSGNLDLQAYGVFVDDALVDLASIAPDEIRDDVQTLSDIWTPDLAVAESLGGDEAAFDAANQAFEDYATRVCGLNPNE